MTVTVVQTIASETFSADVTAHNTVLFAVGCYGSGNTPYDIDDVLFGGSAVPGTVELQSSFVYAPGSGHNQGLFIWMIPNCPGGQTGFTYTPTGGQGTNAVYSVEVHGLGLTPVLDRSSFGTGVNTAVDSGATAPIRALNEFVFAASSMYAGSINNPTGGWTFTELNVSGWAGYQIPGGKGGTYEWQQTADSGDAWNCGVVTVAPSLTPGGLLVGSLP